MQTAALLETPISINALRMVINSSAVIKRKGGEKAGVGEASKRAGELRVLKMYRWSVLPTLNFHLFVLFDRVHIFPNSQYRIR